MGINTKYLKRTFFAQINDTAGPSPIAGLENGEQILRDWRVCTTPNKKSDGLLNLWGWVAESEWEHLDNVSRKECEDRLKAALKEKDIK